MKFQSIEDVKKLIGTLQTFPAGSIGYGFPPEDLIVELVELKIQDGKNTELKMKCVNGPEPLPGKFIYFRWPTP